MITITRWAGLLETLGNECSLSNWRVLVTRPVEGELKNSLPGWSPARFDERRRGARVIDSGAIVVDHDDGLSLEAIMDLWAPYYAIIHSTFTSTPELPKFRVIVPTSRRFTAEAHPRLWRAAQLIDPTIDPSCKDVGRFWFAPAHKSGELYTWRETSGALLDVDEVIASLPVEVPRQVAVPLGHIAVCQSVVERARRYLARVPGAVSGSGGHKSTWSVAVALMRGFSLPADVALELISEWNYRCEPPWSQCELVHKLQSAANARGVGDGYLLTAQRRTA